MFRVALTFWFTVATLFAPLMCCCAPKDVSTGEGVAAGKLPTPIVQARHSCCSVEKPEATGGNQSPAPQAPAECPCQKHCQFKALAAPAVAAPETVQKPTSDYSYPDAVAAFASPVPVASPMRCLGCEPGRPPQATLMLDIFHNLLC